MTAREGNAAAIKRLRIEAAAKGLCYICRCRPAKLLRRTCQDCLDRGYERKARQVATWRKRGRCVNCGRKRAPGILYCARCRDRDNRNNARRYHDAADRKLCRRCRRRVAVDRIMCDGCAAHHAELAKRRHEERKAAGLCTRCGVPADAGLMCARHAEMQRKNERAYRERQRRAA